MGGSEERFQESKITDFGVTLTNLGSNSGSATSSWLCDHEQVTLPLQTFVLFCSAGAETQALTLVKAFVPPLSYTHSPLSEPL